MDDLMTAPQLISALCSIFLCAQLVWAHGEDKPGPHGGFIRMPGAFHTEVVPSGPNQLKVYLLDMNWKNPSIKDSKLQVHLKDKDKVDILAQCEPKGDHHLCTFPKQVDLKKNGELWIEAEREKQKGSAISYALPLQLQSKNGGHDSHDGHH